MTPSKTVKKILFISLCIVMSLALGAMAAWLYLPTYIEHRILPQMLEQSGIMDANCPVRRVGLFGADLGPLRIGKKNNRPITIPSIQLDYSPFGLYRKRIRSVRLAGIDLFGAYDHQGLKIHGLKPTLFNTIQKNNHPPDTEKQPIALPIHIERLALTHTIFHLAWNRKNLHIPVSVAIYSSKENPKIYNSRVTALILGEEVQIDGQVNLDGPILSLNLNSKPLAVDPIIGFLGLNDWISGNALVRVTARLKASLAPIDINALTVEAFFEDLNVLAGTVRLSSSLHDGRDREQPHFKATQIDTNRWQVVLKNILVKGSGEPKLQLSEIRANVQREAAGDIHVDGQLSGSIPAFKENVHAPITLLEKRALNTVFSGNVKPDGTWQFKLMDQKPAKPQYPLSLMTNGVQFSVGTPTFIIDASGDRTDAAAQLTIQVPKIAVSTGDASLDFNKIDVTGNLSAKLAQKPFRPQFKLKIIPSLIKGRIASGANQKPMRLTIPKISISATGLANPTEFDGTLTISGMKAAASEYDFDVKKIEAKIPFQWPAPKQGQSGRITLGSTRYGSWNLGTTSVLLTQNSRGYSFKGDHANPVLPKFVVRFSGDTLLIPPAQPSIILNLDAVRSPDAPDIDLGRFSPKTQGITANGDFRVAGRLRVSDNGASGDVCVMVNQGRVRIPETETSIEGLQTKLCLPELPKIQSAPQQKITFDELVRGKMRIRKGIFDYQVESPKSFFIERGKLQWCSGVVRLGAMRIHADKEDYDIRLDCDRLNLAENTRPIRCRKCRRQRYGEWHRPHSVPKWEADL